ncbi:MAG: hypothetical protein WC359_12370 [Dehalococcoidia bacterium]
MTIKEIALYGGAGIILLTVCIVLGVMSCQGSQAAFASLMTLGGAALATLGINVSLNIQARKATCKPKKD